MEQYFLRHTGKDSTSLRAELLSRGVAVRYASANSELMIIETSPEIADTVKSLEGVLSLEGDYPRSFEE